jgi:hypothetical protein
VTTTTFKSFIAEPFELAIGQPHQMLISSASVAIVAAEAAHLVPYPYNIALAIGAEWAYLRGLISGAGVKTRWAAALNWSAVALVFGYGSLWGFRGFHLIPSTPTPWLAVLLTFIHIGAIGAITICSAMLHRAGEDAKAAARKVVEDREAARQQRELDARAELALEMERKQAELALWEQAEEARARLKMQSQNARMKMRRNAHPEPMNAVCPKCGLELDKPRWLAARRWGYCAACKEA